MHCRHDMAYSKSRAYSQLQDQLKRKHFSCLRVGAKKKKSVIYYNIMFSLSQPSIMWHAINNIQDITCVLCYYVRMYNW